MKHDRIKKSDWNLIANKKIEDAEVTKVWKDTEGNIHVELTYPKGELHDEGTSDVRSKHVAC